MALCGLRFEAELIRVPLDTVLCGACAVALAFAEGHACPCEVPA